MNDVQIANLESGIDPVWDSSDSYHAQTLIVFKT
ncbi:MAG: hypothetical protein QG556_1148 [Pseudomonadota bacterium]|nr:hypothetical protein [Pseudomonadota bacterium]